MKAMQSLRRSLWIRLFALACAVMVPGLGGSLLMAAHPCSVAMPWLTSAETTSPSGATAEQMDHASHHAGHAATSGAAHADHGDSAPAPDGEPHGHGDTCHCIGACASFTPALAAAHQPVIAVAFSSQPVASGFPVIAARLAARLRDLLPPATAPPLA